MAVSVVHTVVSSEQFSVL